MADQPSRKRACVMIVEPHLDFGIKLADWLAARGCQAVLIRSIDTAIAECTAVNPQAVFIKLSRSHPTAGSNLPDLLRAIEATCARAPVLIMVDRACEGLARIMREEAIRHFPIKPTDFKRVGHILTSELNANTASLKSATSRSASHGGWTPTLAPHRCATPDEEEITGERAACHRCQGLMHPVDPLDSLRARQACDRGRDRAWRCLSCGDLIDPVIMHNRMHQKSPRGPRRGTTPRQTVFKRADS